MRVKGLVHSAQSADAARRAGASDIAHVDLADPPSLLTACRGLNALIVVAPPFDRDEQRHASAAIDAATTAGVEHLVYYSVLYATTPSMPHHQRKANVEVAVRESGLRWTIVQPAMYQQTLLSMIDTAADGVVRVPYRRSAPFQLVDPDRHVYASYELAGPQQLGTDEMVDEVLGREAFSSPSRRFRSARWRC